MKVTICIGSACHIKGARSVVSQLQSLVSESATSDRIELGGSLCLGKCGNGVSVCVDGEYFHVLPENVREFFEHDVLSRL